MRKGFTLIELLAVIVILAIIALIATPIILGIIEDARVGSIEASANGYIDAVEYQLARTEIKGEKIDNGVYYTHQLEIDLDGEKPTYGEIIIEKGNVKESNLCIDGYTVEYKNNNLKVVGTCTPLYKEKNLNGTDPVLKGDLIPININPDGTVIKADITKEWYNYENKEWANAVILMDGKNYKVGEKILESDIESYFVWIPKYSYKLFDLGNYNGTIEGEVPINKTQTIDIKFGINTTSDKNKGECTTPMVSGESGNCDVGEYMTHPAFLSFDTNGIWVGKFETSTILNDIKIKPNLELKIINIKEAFELEYNYKRNIDSHMMKNTEWGAVAYLTYSNYGINKNVNVNNYYIASLNYSKAGYSSTALEPTANHYGETEDITQPYNTEIGYKASTTGNITGIYDMAGGHNDTLASYVKGYYASSGFDDDTISIYDKKYFDIYNENSNEDSYNYRILGDAIGEVGPYYRYSILGIERKRNSWDGAAVIFPYPEQPWIYRGGYSRDMESSGVFFGYRTGGFGYYGSLRVTLAF